ncbi:alpha/beta-hydrolase family protein [Actinomycetospora sp. NBRC 106378]|uniref:alpha/beta-hydrolase family protein n=1 Tax=Actinomycetospora sp. NBRC 106378 TaxID=3032208 RepID=UPI0024A58074|nr:alpha/beta-hydrolase family protein [Actinomycetospora sp. NBRC 106378]GLZ54596.1 membrane protein [Actinomycetospora sp. NBRC 106378]
MRRSAAESDRRRRWSLHPLGLTLGVGLAALGCTPTLIPRTGFFQGLVSGVLLAAGYLLGVTVARLVRPRVRLRPSPTARALGWVLLAMLLVPVVVLALRYGYARQAAQAALLGVRPPTVVSWLVAVPVAVAVLAVLVAVVRGVRALPRWPRRVVVGLGVVVVLLALVSVAGIPGVNPARTVLDRAFAAQNDGVFGGATRPTSPLRSGSPASLLSWDSLGRGGRTFVSSGPPATALAQASGRPAVEPIRVYVGLGSSADAAERARLAVDELRRTGAFDRPVIAVLTTTGTGFVDAEAVDALELTWGGDTAVVTSQYSLMPSALSLLLDGDRVAAAGTTMYDAVRAAVDALPPGRPRPRVVVFGESLGALGSQAAFASVDRVRDGALWNGPPNSSPLWRSLVAGRDPGTPEVRPVVGNGRQVRFGGGTATPGLATDPPAPWPAPRTVYLQHPSDPVVWWSPRLLWERPDWLAEPHGDDVLPDVRWFPLVTFWQVTMDMIRAQEVPFGHGHNYGPESLDAWTDVVPPPGWTPADTARAHAVQEAGGLPTPGA